MTEMLRVFTQQILVKFSIEGVHKSVCKFNIYSCPLFTIPTLQEVLQ